MTGGKCARCGAEDSMFWYPYAFGIAPIPDVRTNLLADCQRYMLCDKCQTDFIDFMRNEKWPWFDPKKLAEMMENAEPMPFIPEVKE